MTIQLSYEQKSYIFYLLKDYDLAKIENSTVKNFMIDFKSKAYHDTDYIKYTIKDINNILSYNFTIEEVKKDGITFTPLPLVEYMYKDVLSLPVSEVKTLKIADISMGNGVFFVGILIFLKEQYPDFSIINYIENNIYGYELQSINIEYAKLILSVLSLYYGEDKENIKFNFHEVDSLKYLLNVDKKIKFDLIVGNPPYVKQQNIDKDYRIFLLENFNTISSNYNIYYAFIETMINLVNKQGRILLLVPNYILKIKSAKNLRQLLIHNHYIHRIVDFKSTKIFEGIDTYSMIIELQPDSKNLMYKIVENSYNNVKGLLNQPWKLLSSESISENSINLVNTRESQLINQVTNQEQSLDISTGIATQKDKLYLIDRIEEYNNQLFFYKIFNGKEYPIDNDFVRKIYKGSGQKEFQINQRYIIYPYIKNINGIPSLVKKNILLNNYPDTYKYFLDAREELEKRSGIYTNEDWYRYGRSQSLNRFEPKILFPTNSEFPNFHFIDEYALFYNGYAIYGIKDKLLSREEMKILEIILNSHLLEKFISLTSYYIGGGYMSYQKKYIEQFTIPLLSNKTKQEILSLYNDRRIADLNTLIYSLYQLDYEDYI